MLGQLFDREDADLGSGREAFGWYRKAAEQGHALAQFALGLRYDSGHDVARDYEAAHFWYLCAARQGHARAQFNLGVMYASGQGVGRDQVEAWCWLQRAAQAGIAAADGYARRIAARMEPALLAQARHFVGETDAP
jgi:TPR repeat protein